MREEIELAKTAAKGTIHLFVGKIISQIIGLIDIHVREFIEVPRTSFIIAEEAEGKPR